jgi:hypothetical protein
MACGVLAATVACDAEPLAPTATSVTPAQLAAAVTGAAADSIDQAGLFLLADRTRKDGTEITEQRARELAIAYWKTIEQELRIRAKRDRGGVPLSASLRLCPRAFYAESGYDPLPPDLPVEMRRGLGPQWLLGLCDGNTQELAISVSSEATDLGVRADGTISILKSGDFWDVGVPPGGRIPAWPENAVVAAAGLTAVGADGRAGVAVGRPCFIVPEGTARPPNRILWKRPQHNLTLGLTAVGADGRAREAGGRPCSFVPFGIARPPTCIL